MAVVRKYYKRKNSSGGYDIVYLYTDANAVATTAERQFVSSEEKTTWNNKADSHSHPYMPLAGGQFTGKVSFSGSTALPENTSMQYLLGIDAFASGGTVKWTSKANLLSGYALIGSSNDASTANSIYGAKAYADAKIAALVDSAPDTLNTLNELAVAINTNKDAVTAINSSITNKVDKTTKVNGKALSSNVTITTEDIASKLSTGGTLGQDIQHLSDDKVDKASGKGLSTNDFTTAYKNKLEGIASGATAVTESTVSGWGFTKNTGTVTSVKVGSTSYNPSSGVISLPAYPSNYLPLSGGTIEGDLTLHATSGNSPKLIFQRGDNTGTITDWNINVVSGALNFNTVSTFGSTTEKIIMTLGYSGGLDVVGNIKENGTLLSSKYLGINAKASDSSKLNGQEASYYLDYNNLSNKPATPTNTWRGIQNNLTSTSTTESLSAYQGKLLNEKFANYLPLTGGTITAGNTLILGATSNANSSKLKWGTVNSKTPYFGYASDQTDGTFVWSITGTTYQTGLAIGGGSGNLLWKGVKVATVNDIPSGVAVDTALSSTSSNAIANKAVSAAIDILTEDVENLKQADNLYLPKAGGTITGTVTQTAGDMITNYCAVKSAGHETGSYSKIATLSSTGYIRYRTPAEMKTDLGVGQIKIGSKYYTATLSGTTLALTSI